MTRFILILRLLAEITPALITAIKAVEQAMPESGRGREKLELVRVIVEQAYTELIEVTLNFTEVWPHIQRLIATIVAAYNSTGVFKK